MTFKEKIIVEYPLPIDLSVWGGDNVHNVPVSDLDLLIESCVDELTSDITIICYVEASSMVTLLPADTIVVSSARLNFQFQGNRFVKYTFDPAAKKVSLRYYPATITYRRRLRVEDLGNLNGDLLRYAKSYILWKMSEKELMILKSVDLKTDNSAVSLEYLAAFCAKSQKTYEDLKPEILLYAASF